VGGCLEILITLLLSTFISISYQLQTSSKNAYYLTKILMIRSFTCPSVCIRILGVNKVSNEEN